MTTLRKVFKNIRHMLSCWENNGTFDLKTNVSIWWVQCINLVTVYGSNDEFGSSSWPRKSTRVDHVQEPEIIYDDSWLLSVDENDFVPWSSDHMDESKGTCLFWFSFFLGRISHPSEASIKWKEQIIEFQRSNEYAEMYGIDGEAIEFECNISQDSHRLRFSDKSRKIWKLDR